MSRRNPGEGSVAQRSNGTWCGTLQVDGKRRFVYAKTEREAKTKLLALRREADVNGVLSTPGKKTVGDLLDAWISNVAPTLKPRTIADYKAVCDRYIRPQLGSKRLTRFCPEDVQRLYAKLQTTGAKRVPSYAHAVLHRACEIAVLWGWLPQNPCDRVLKPAQNKERKEIWSLQDLLAFLHGTEDSWLHPLWITATATGCRLGELLALSWEDVDGTAARISITRTVQYISGEMVYSTPKTRSGVRVLSLPAEAVAALRHQKALQAEWRLKLGPTWAESGLVFSSPTGSIMLHSTVDRAMRRECKRLGLAKLTPHGLRHMAASVLLAKGLPVTAVSARLGHASPAITMAIYAHAMKHQDQHAAAMMQEAMLG